MDSQTSAKLTSLQRDLAELELREHQIKAELEDIEAKKKVILSEVSKINKNDRVTQDILTMVYEQRRPSGTPKR